ncbi:hypothetical protein SNEBB_011139 [Seison nebaliae]|nr:hypothetical protein SNEBB_011139 [Seison nebaliae]
MLTCQEEVLYKRNGRPNRNNMVLDLHRSVECANDVSCLGIHSNGSKCKENCEEIYLTENKLPIRDCTKVIPVDHTLPQVISTFVNSTYFFGRSWQEFKCGFYIDANNFYLGNDYLYRLTKDKDMIKADLNYGSMKNWMQNWTIGPEETFYKIHFDQVDQLLTGNGRFVLIKNGTEFRVKDVRNLDNCGENDIYGFWFIDCNLSENMRLRVLQ